MHEPVGGGGAGPTCEPAVANVNRNANVKSQREIAM